MARGPTPSEAQATVQEAVLGEVLPNIGKRPPQWAVSEDGLDQGPGRRRSFGLLQSKARNAVRVPQSVVKRVVQGGCHSPKELRRQMTYVLRDEANVAAWSNAIGIDRSFDEAGMEGEIADWSASWRGAPKRGHTDHIILSFPRGTDRDQAEAIARQWGQEVFGSGWYRDRYRYVASLHHNTEHVHAHFIVDKVGMDEGKFLSIGKYSEINYDMMRERHVEVAAEYGLSLNASTRLSRGIVENAPRQADIQAARLEGRQPYHEPLSDVIRAKRLVTLRQHAQEYRTLSVLAQMSKGKSASQQHWLERILEGATSAFEKLDSGDPIMAGFGEAGDMPPSVDPSGQLIAARDQLLVEARETWANIQAMETGAEKVALQSEFAGQARGIAAFFGTAFMAEHSAPMARAEDPYAIGSVDTLAGFASDERHPSHVKADSFLDRFRSDLEQAFLPYGDRLEAADVGVAEIAARFVSASRSKAQFDATRPSGSEARAAWKRLERDLQSAANDVYDRLEIDADLQEAMVRRELMDASYMDRLSDIRALDRLVHEVRSDLDEDALKQIASGSMDPLVDRIGDLAVRQAVRSELQHIEETLDRLQECGELDPQIRRSRDTLDQRRLRELGASRDSDLASTYRKLGDVHDAAPSRDQDQSTRRRTHARDDRGDELEM